MVVFFSCITHSLWDLGSLTTGGTPAAGSDQVLTLDGQGIPWGPCPYFLWLFLKKQVLLSHIYAIRMVVASVHRFYGSLGKKWSSGDVPLLTHTHTVFLLFLQIHIPYFLKAEKGALPLSWKSLRHGHTLHTSGLFMHSPPLWMTLSLLVTQS